MDFVKSELQNIRTSCMKVLDYAEKHDYKGYSKFDACNSPFLKLLSLNNEYLRLLFIQLVMRFPFNLRGILGVQQSRNPKGMALFAMAYLNLYKATKDDSFLDKARHCLNWLANNYSEGYSGYCWGYNFDWQSPHFYAPKYTPNCVVTVFGGEAFILAYSVTNEEKYLDIARSAVDFILKDLPVLYSDEKMKCIAYVPFEVSSIVININALSAALLAKISHHTEEEMIKTEARRLINYVVDKQTDYGGWYYTHPAKDSHIRHDNYHTGGILDGIWDYSDAAGDSSFMDSYFQGLEYYDANLFLEDGAPKFMNDRVYPFDIHGAAQGIITFCKAARFDEKYLHKALAITNWTLSNLQASEGYFYYQKRRFYTKKFTLMRWCNSWMARALSELMLICTKEVP